MKLSLNSQIFIGAVLGVAFGTILGHSPLASTTGKIFLPVFDLLGKVFLNLLKMIMVPLVFISITAGMANLKKTPHSRRIWMTLLLYSLTTTCLAAITGLTVMNLIKPGVGLNVHLLPTPTHPLSGGQPFNIITIVLAAALSGTAIILSGDKGQNILKKVNELFELMMTIVSWIMRLAPLGIMGLLAKLVAEANATLLFVLGKYIIVVVGSTLFHGLITLPLILWMVTKITPWRLLLGLKEALITAFSTSSSTATLPVSLRCITENLKVDKNIARFVLPVGAVLNMDGTVMYEAMAALFVANLCGAHLTLLSQMAVMFTAMMVSIGAPGIPSAGMVTMIMVLQSVGLPLQALGLLIAIDRPLDTIRTVVNVEGDCIGACVVHAISRKISNQGYPFQSGQNLVKLMT